MTFTDANPTFPYQSSEAKSQLGIPDSSEIHLAITKLAERLIALAEGTTLCDSNIRISALRTASEGVLFSYPFEVVATLFRSKLGLHIEQDASDRIGTSKREDWLGQAVRYLRAEGVEIPTSFGEQVSNYGWRNTPHATCAPSKRANRMNPFELQILQAAEIVAGADALIISAGAGMGVDSGLPDFRGNDGFWKAYPALAKAQLNFTEVASPKAFHQDPKLAWGFYGHRLALYRQTVPHPGFAILRKWCERMQLGARIFTSNVDGQFQKAGFSEDQVHECHGSIHHLQCMNECASGVWSAEQFVPEIDVETCHLVNEPPVCPHCGGLARPNVLMFDDWNWMGRRSDAQRRAETNWLSSLAVASPRIVIVEIGAGTAVPSVRHFSHRISQEYGAPIIRINPRESQVPSSRDIGFATGSLEALRGIDLAIENLR